MTAQDIVEIIRKDYDRFNNAQFAETMPDWLLEGFDNKIMEMPQIHAPYTSAQLNSVLGKLDDPTKLTNYEVGWVCNVLQAIPPKLISKDIKKFQARKAVIANLAYRYQQRYENEKKKLDAKESQLIRDLRNQPKIVTR